MLEYSVRPVRAEEWEQVRELRVRAVHDPAAAVAFTDTVEHTASLPDDFWRDRAAGGSVDAGDQATARQFVAEGPDGTWIGTVTGLVEYAGEVDFEGRVIAVDGCAVVGAFVDASYRGGQVLGALFDALADWTSTRGIGPLRLTVHADNARAVRAYEKQGFVVTGEPFTGVLGPALEMRRA